MTELPCELSKITLETACALLLLAVAYKIYKMRISSESDCCNDRFRLATANRGDSDSDLRFHDRESDDDMPGLEIPPMN